MHPKKLVLAVTPLALLAQANGDRLHARDLAISTPETLVNRSPPSDGLKRRCVLPAGYLKSLNGTQTANRTTSAKKPGALPQHRVRKRFFWGREQGLSRSNPINWLDKDKDDDHDKNQDNPKYDEDDEKEHWTEKWVDEDEDGNRILTARNENPQSHDKNAGDSGSGKAPKVSVSVDRKPGSGVDVNLEIGKRE